MEAPPPATAFTGFDWFLILLVAVSTLMAFQKGIIRVLLSLAGLVAAITCASWNYMKLASRLHPTITSFVLCEVIAFVVLFVLVSVLFGVAAAALSKSIKAIGLGFFDRMLGAAFGLVRGVLLGMAAIMVLTAFFPDALWLEESALSPYFLTGVDALSFVVPAHFQDQIAIGAKRLLHAAPGLLEPHTHNQSRH